MSNYEPYKRFGEDEWMPPDDVEYITDAEFGRFLTFLEQCSPKTLDEYLKEISR